MASLFFCFLMIPPPPTPTLFPYTTLFRSGPAHDASGALRRGGIPRPPAHGDESPTVDGRGRAGGDPRGVDGPRGARQVGRRPMRDLEEIIGEALRAMLPVLINSERGRLHRTVIARLERAVSAGADPADGGHHRAAAPVGGGPRGPPGGRAPSRGVAEPSTAGWRVASGRG